MEEDHQVFWHHYKLNILERKGALAQSSGELIAIGLIELSYGKYACVIVMPTKKNIFDNWTKNIFGDYHPVNKEIKFDYHPMPTLEELFDFLGEVDMFTTLDPWSRYHQLPLRLEDQVKSIFWGVNEDNKNSLYHWKFLPFISNNTLA